MPAYDKPQAKQMIAIMQQIVDLVIDSEWSDDMVTQYRDLLVAFNLADTVDIDSLQTGDDIKTFLKKSVEDMKVSYVAQFDELP